MADRKRSPRIRTASQRKKHSTGRPPPNARGSLSPKKDDRRLFPEWQATFDAVHDSIWVLDLDFRILRCNAASCKIFHRDPAELLGRRCWEVIYQGTAPFELCLMRRMMESKHREVMEFPMGDRWYTAAVDPIFNPAQEVIGAVHILYDVTEQKRSETLLQESTERYRQLFDLESDVILLIDNASGRILEANDAAVALYGYSREELLAMKNTDLSAQPEETRRVTQTTPLKLEKVVTIPKRLHRKKDGAVFPVEITGRFFSYRGRPVHIAAIRDITERTKTEEALRESRQMLETVLDTIPARVFWKDLNLTYIGCNRPFAQDAGFQSPEEVVGRDDYTIGWKEHIEDYRVDDREVIETGQAKIQYEESATNAEGKHIWVITSKIPLRGPDGKVRGVLGTYEDITERKKGEEEIRTLNAELERRVVQRTEQLEAANRELEAFTFSVSHDLRAPLRAIDGFTRILAEDYGKNLDPEGQRLCAVIQKNTRHMNELIDDLLALSRLSRSQMEFMPNDMQSMAESVFEELTAAENRARIDCKIGTLPVASGDPILLRQVWENLISNALKFTSKRENPVIQIGSEETPEETVFFVRDNGAGFNMEYTDRLFGVFQRLHAESEFEGTGVGLAIVQRVIRRHGGRVWAEGEVDSGATFYFSLPKQSAAQPPLSAHQSI